MQNSNIMEVQIISPNKVLYSGESISVTVPGSLGAFQILKKHAPIVSILEKGEVIVKDKSGKTHLFNISGGVLESSGNIVSIAVHSVL